MSSYLLRAVALFALVLSAFSFLAPSQADGQVAWRTSPKEAFDAAVATGKPIVVYVETDWCHYCKNMKRETWRQPQVESTIAQQYVALSLDGDLDKRIVKRMGISGFPATLVYDSKGHFIDMKPGFVDATSMLAWLAAKRPAIRVSAVGGGGG